MGVFPHRCVKCNEPTEPPNKRRTVYWHHPAVYVLLLVYVIVYIIVAVIVRKTAKIDPGSVTSIGTSEAVDRDRLDRGMFGGSRCPDRALAGVDSG